VPSTQEDVGDSNGPGVMANIPALVTQGSRCCPHARILCSCALSCCLQNQRSHYQDCIMASNTRPPIDALDQGGQGA
jgi:hypothetical protein